MRIVIDLQGAQTESRFRGIGRYSLSLALAMARNAGEHDIWLILNAALPDSLSEIRHAFAGVVPNERIRSFKVPEPASEVHPANAWRVRAAEKIREHFIQQLNPDVLLLTSIFEGLTDNAVTSIGAFSTAHNTAVILYDLIPFHNQAVYLPTPAHQSDYHRKIASLKKADLLLAISDYSRQDATEALGTPAEQVVNISAAIDARFQQQTYTEQQTTKLKERFGITRKMVMYAPGGFDIRKNFDGLIQAYARLPSPVRATHQLVIVSKISDSARTDLNRLRVAAGIKNDEFVLTGYVSDEDLVALYNLATLFVFPSKYEGFGLPVLEAMACGTATIGANTTSVPEVIGWEEAMFDPASPQAIADKMLQVLTDDNLHTRLREHSLRQAEKFSWDTSAKKTIAAFETLHLSSFRKIDATPGKETITPTSALLKSIAEIKCAQHHCDGDLAAAANAIAFNTSGDTAKQLLLDVSVIVRQDAKSGIQRVVRSILLALLNNPPHDYAVRPIYFDDECYRYASVFTSQIMGNEAQESVDEVAEFNQGDIYLGLDLNAHLADILHPLHKHHQHIGVGMYFIVYDILVARRPDWWRENVAPVFEEWLQSIAQVATGLVCISHAVANDVQAWLTENKPKRSGNPIVSSFHLGADITNSLPSKGLPENAPDVLSTLHARPSFLMVGTLEPRKGHVQTLGAFELLWKQGIDVNLVIVGKNGWLVDALINRLHRHAEKDKRLFWLEGISDEYLERIYAASTCLIAASEGEGFGLPLIEAAQHKRAIIARDIPVFREVAGEHAFYFTGLDAVSLMNGIHAWMLLNAKGLAPQSDSMPWLTWKQSVEQLLANILPIGQSA